MGWWTSWIVFLIESEFSKLLLLSVHWTCMTPSKLKYHISSISHSIITPNSEICPWEPAGNPGKFHTKYEHLNCRTQTWPQVEMMPNTTAIVVKISIFSASSQFVRPPLNQRTGATAVTRLPATASPRKQSSSTSATRATLWRATTSSSPARMASGTVPCRLAVDSHKVRLSRPHAVKCKSKSVNHIFHFLSVFWFPADKEPSSPLGIPALSIVASTASSVALILLLVVLFVLVQPKLKSFHHSR